MLINIFIEWNNVLFWGYFKINFECNKIFCNLFVFFVFKLIERFDVVINVEDVFEVVFVYFLIELFFGGMYLNKYNYIRY